MDLPPTTFMRAPASMAMLHLSWAGDLAFATGDSLAPTARLFGYTGGLITCAQRSAMSQADLVLRDLFVRRKGHWRQSPDSPTARHKPPADQGAHQRAASPPPTHVAAGADAAHRGPPLRG